MFSPPVEVFLLEKKMLIPRPSESSVCTFVPPHGLLRRRSWTTSRRRRACPRRRPSLSCPVSWLWWTCWCSQVPSTSARSRPRRTCPPGAWCASVSDLVRSRLCVCSLRCKQKLCAGSFWGEPHILPLYDENWRARKWPPQYFSCTIIPLIPWNPPGQLR